MLGESRSLSKESEKLTGMEQVGYTMSSDIMENCSDSKLALSHSLVLGKQIQGERPIRVLL